ncbi:hypothetical protein M2401_006851 [Pseudomonas sp. JUb42]|nr:hypothetical protein [Pseudomonas sp. JUb42]
MGGDRILLGLGLNADLKLQRKDAALLQRYERAYHDQSYPASAMDRSWFITCSPYVTHGFANGRDAKAPDDADSGNGQVPGPDLPLVYTAG